MAWWSVQSFWHNTAAWQTDRRTESLSCHDGCPVLTHDKQRPDTAWSPSLTIFGMVTEQVHTIFAPPKRFSAPTYSFAANSLNLSSESNQLKTSIGHGHKFWKSHKHRATDAPLRGVYIPKFRKIYSFGDLTTHPYIDRVKFNMEELILVDSSTLNLTSVEQKPQNPP